MRKNGTPRMLKTGIVVLLGTALVLSSVSMAKEHGDKSNETKPAKDSSSRAMKDMEKCEQKCMKNMSKMKTLLTQARKDAKDNGASDAVKKIDQAMELMKDQRMQMKQMRKTCMKHMRRGKMQGKRGMMRDQGEMAQEENGVVNSNCPIMGNKIDPNSVPENLTRNWRGKKVGFCCPACPAKWDKLSDAEKEEKLGNVTNTSRKRGHNRNRRKR